MSRQKRKPVGFWRELMMLREKDVFRRCYNEDQLISMVACLISGSVFILLLGAIIFLDQGLIKAALLIAIYLVIAFVALVVIPVLVSWKSVLRPAYHRRELANAQTELNLATQELEASLPSTHYRLASIEKSPASTEELRAYADNTRLSEDQKSKLARVVAAEEKAQEAEQELDRVAPNVGRWITS